MFSIPTGCQLHNLRLLQLHPAWDNHDMVELTKYTVSEFGDAAMVDDVDVIPDPGDPNPEWYACMLCGDEFYEWDEAADHVRV